MPEPTEAQAQNENAVSAMDVYGKALKELPSATTELAQEAWERPSTSIAHAGKTFVMSAGIGTAMGYFLPAKGPAAWAVGAILTAPMLYQGYKSLTNAADEAQKPGADVDAVAHTLARHTVSGTTELVLNLAGGIAGTEAGYAMKESPKAISRLGQSTQKSIVETENKFLSGIVNNKYVRGVTESGPNPKLPMGKIHTMQGEAGEIAGISRFDSPTVLPEHTSWVKRPFSSILQRVREFDNRDVMSDGMTARAARVEDDYVLAQGSLHLHTKQSDGMGTVTSLSAKAKEQGQNVILVSDHNHLAARDGVKPGDPRIPEQNGPVIAEAPQWYAEQYKEAAKATVNGEHVVIIGSEMGTIGKVGNPKSGGKNHFIMVEMPQFFEAIRKPRTLWDESTAPIRRALGLKEKPAMVMPDVVKYNDGDMNGLITYIEKNKLKDSTGNDPVFIAAHPRFSEDHSPSLPSGTRGADYGRYSFKTKEEWVQRSGKYFSNIEVIKGGAMRRVPVDEIGAKDADLTSLRGYINDGFHMSPVVGRDAHFGDPGMIPAETGIWVSSIDKAGVLEGLRSRRTFATTHMDRLNGRVVANDRYQMGQIVDQAVTNELTLTTKIGGKIEPDAQYTLKLWGDQKIGDRTLAEVMQEVKVSGDELSGMGNQFTFDKINHNIGKKGGAYFVEVTRKDPTTSHVDHLYMAPFWIEPLSGGGRHSLYMKFLAGQAPSMFIPSGS
jgi:hypothetical protein